MKRTPMPRAKKPMKRTGRIKPKKRKASSFARIYGSLERVRFVKSLPCAVSTDPCSGPIENAHTENGGVGWKGPYASIIPLCTRHHALQHLMGVETFAEWTGLNYAEEAARTEARWQAHKGEVEHV